MQELSYGEVSPRQVVMGRYRGIRKDAFVRAYVAQ